MYQRWVVFAAACSVLSSVVASTLVTAQEASPPPGTAAPVTTLLPPVVVEGKQTAKKPKAAAKKKASSSAPSVATQQPAPQQQPTGPGNSSASDNTAYGPVRDYSPKNTATGTKTDTPLKEVPQSISVVGAEQVRDMGSQTAQEALRYVPGVVASAYGNAGRTDSTFIRGAQPTEYLDGMRRTLSYYTFNYRLDPYFLERMEVLRGPSSVLYGQVAVGGIINSVSKLPQQETGGEISLEYGTFDFKQVKFDMTGAITSDKKWSYRLTGTARDAETQTDVVEDDRYAVQPAITYRPDGNTTITFLGHFQRDRAGTMNQFFPIVGTLLPNVNGKYIARNRYAGEPNDRYDTDADSGTLLIEHKFNSAVKLRHVSRYTDIHNDYLSSYTYPWSYQDAAQELMKRTRIHYLTDTQVFNQDTSLEVKFATGVLSHRVLGGVDYTNYQSSQGSASATSDTLYNPYSASNPKGQWKGTGCGGTVYDGVTKSYDVPQVCSMTDQSVEQTGLYIQDQIRVGSWIALLGMRKDWLETTTASISGQKDEAVTYRAGLMYEFASGVTPYFSYGESFVPVVERTYSGTPLDPQRGRMYEVGFKYAPKGASFAINGALFDIAEDSRSAVDPVNNYPYYVQTGAVTSKGGEIEFTGKVTENLKIVAGYSYTQAQYADGTAIDGNQIESIPKHLASFWGVWEFDQPELKGWSAGAGVRYIGKSWDSKAIYEVPDVALFDAMIAYEEEHWRWQLNGSNLEDKVYLTTCLNRGDCWFGSARTITTSLTYKY